ncbi:DUF3348 domain-containing protein [Bordetella avium]|uniref:DUF3348 domain-containing protein n=1 Tax=Bordetella avium (strain 197N) TaxID=360910 RepID=Q2KWW0_BORA1|nr:DUF3348 domain-containing protein [Bordetella avium]RIQ48908.1 DUF3348 domain-containing protein [Bordetella avium]RIQ74857.1 DUF3348 domain-containing protein [Bordetella avium]CAJ48365.1 conserved hypothetical protein [Bordetella avium 197N]
MVQSPRRSGVGGPAFIRLLTRLTDADVPESGQSLSDRLSQWLGWTDGLALAAALNSHPMPGETRLDRVQERDLILLRAGLSNAIARDIKQRGPSPFQAKDAPAEDDYRTYRQLYLALQQTMETRIGNLRTRLRATLATSTPELTQLAVIDAIMERALIPRERALLANVPGLLEKHFQRLRLAEEEASQPEARHGGWLQTFRQDMQSVLLAELDVRLQPVEGLFAALRIRTS